MAVVTELKAAGREIARPALSTAIDKHAPIRMNSRPAMESGDWFHFTVNVVLGSLLGSVLYNLVLLGSSAGWLAAAIFGLLVFGAFWGVLALERGISALFDKLFGSASISTRPRKPRRPRPLARALSFPLGLALGGLLGVIGLDHTILAFLAQ